MGLDSAELDALRADWKRAVTVTTRRIESQLLGTAHIARPVPCWFGENVPGIDACEYGPRGIEGAHWLKRQRVEKTIAQQFGLPEIVCSPKWQRSWSIFPAEFVDHGLVEVFLAAWDPRNGVPACEKHHQRFDGTRVDATNPLVIWRHEVPAHVEAFALDWGLETALEDRNPAIGGGI